MVEGRKTTTTMPPFALTLGRLSITVMMCLAFFAARGDAPAVQDSHPPCSDLLQAVCADLPRQGPCDYAMAHGLDPCVAARGLSVSHNGPETVIGGSPNDRGTQVSTRGFQSLRASPPDVFSRG